MSDTSTTGVPAGTGDETAQGAQPSVRVLAQYIKDLSFENPRAPMSLQKRDQTPAINIGVNVGARAMSENDFEVTLSLECKAAEKEETNFVVELSYAGVIHVENMKKEHMQPFLLIEGPRLLFPFARQIVAEAVRNGGFPPLMIDPIDFVALYRKNLERAQQQKAEAPAN